MVLDHETEVNQRGKIVTVKTGEDSVRISTKTFKDAKEVFERLEVRVKESKHQWKRICKYVKQFQAITNLGGYNEVSVCFKKTSIKLIDLDTDL